MLDRKETLARRTMLGAVAAVGSIAGVATVLSPKKGLPVEAAKAPAHDDEAPQGYRVTEHIKRYYATTRV